MSDSGKHALGARIPIDMSGNCLKMQILTICKAKKKQVGAELCQAQIKLGLADHLARLLACLLPGGHLP